MTDKNQVEASFRRVRDHGPPRSETGRQEGHPAGALTPFPPPRILIDERTLPPHEEAAMLYFGRFEVTQPAGMSADQFLRNWYEEAQAASQATAAGVIKGLWKVAG